MTRLSPALRRAVRRRARERCEYCQSSTLLTGEEFTADPIFPTARGGTDALDNLCYCCFWCNSYKSAVTVAKDPRTGIAVPLFDPRRDDWSDHFRWSPNATRIIGRTPVGRQRHYRSPPLKLTFSAFSSSLSFSSRSV
jgi:5-methylcytosine-specific restriction endonuclease McrA